MNDVQLYAVRLANTETIAQSHQEWSLEKQAVAVDKSMRKLKSNESWHSFFYGLGYFSVIFLLLSGWTIAKSTRYAHKHRFGTLASSDWLNRRYGEQETY